MWNCGEFHSVTMIPFIILYRSIVFFICSCYYFSIDRDSNLNGLTGSTQAENLVLCGYTLSMQSKALLTGVTDTQPSVLRILPRITFTCHRGKECSSFGERTPLFIARLLI